MYGCCSCIICDERTTNGKPDQPFQRSPVHMDTETVVIPKDASEERLQVDKPTTLAEDNINDVIISELKPLLKIQLHD